MEECRYGGQALGFLGVGFDVECEERRSITARCSNIGGRLLVDEECLAAEIEREDQNRIAVTQSEHITDRCGAPPAASARYNNWVSILDIRHQRLWSRIALGVTRRRR